MNTKKFEIIDEFTKEFATGKNKYYKCRCNCGNTFESAKSNVDSGKTTSCNKGGCNSHVIDMIGKKFGRLTVLQHHSRNEGYKCKCDCGNETIARTYALKSGKHKSCGCLAKELVSKRTYKGNGIYELNMTYRNYKASAKKRNHVFDLDINQFETLIKSPCVYCGKTSSLKLDVRRKFAPVSSYCYNGVDRINNNIGYTIENCVSCCNICNNSKSTLSINDWKEWIINVYTNLFKN